MKRETEIKFFVDDFAPVRKRLRELGAKFEHDGPELDWILDVEKRSLRRRKFILRIRSSGGKCYLTFKEKQTSGSVKEADEYEVEVSDASELRKIFEKLGFPAAFKYKKPNREYWGYENAHITLDQFPFGRFVEIEATKSAIFRLAKKLSLDPSRTSTKSYRWLLWEYRKKRLSKK